MFAVWVSLTFLALVLLAAGMCHNKTRQPKLSKHDSGTHAVQDQHDWKAAPIKFSETKSHSWSCYYQQCMPNKLRKPSIANKLPFRCSMQIHTLYNKSWYACKASESVCLICSIGAATHASLPPKRWLPHHDAYMPKLVIWPSVPRLVTRPVHNRLGIQTEYCQELQGSGPGHET